MNGWSNAARQGTWGDPSGIDRRPRRRHRSWTPVDIAALVLAFVIRWELGLAFLALKLWHQSSGYEGSVVSFARTKWDALAALTSGFLANQSFSVPAMFRPKSSGNVAFDAWRRTELDRIETERQKLQVAEREFMAYRDELLAARDREAFERFMQGRAS